MNRTLLVIATVAMVALAGCSGLPGGQSNDGGADVGTERVSLSDAAAEAEAVEHTLRVEVDEETAGATLSAVGATYPREHFTVNGAQHDAVSVGVDRDGDGELDRTFDESHVSGVNNNDFSFDVTLDTDYTLEEGDAVVFGYPDVDNPTEPGEYDVEVRLNDRQTANATVTIE